MSAQSRVYLREGFDDGERPTGKDFADIFDSFINIEDDKVSLDVNKNLSVPAGLTLFNSPAGPNGTIRFNGTKVQVSVGGVWSDIAGESGAFQIIGVGPNVGFTGGNVGITNMAPTHKLDVQLGTNSGAGERVRFGRLVVHTGPVAPNDGAFISHESQTGDTSFALKQDAAANTILNCGQFSALSLNQGGTATPRLQLLTSGNFQISPATSVNINGNTIIGTAGTPRAFSVNGTAAKTGGGPFDVLASDRRVKKDIQPLTIGLKELCKLEPVYYKFNGVVGTPDDEKQYVGLIANDVQKVIPSIVKKSILEDEAHKDLLTYDSGPLTFMLINAVRELTERVEKLEAQLAAKKNTKN